MEIKGYEELICDKVEYVSHYELEHLITLSSKISRIISSIIAKLNSSLK
jgi:hypothetical protein